MKKQLLTAMVLAAAVGMAGCSHGKQEAAATETAAVETTKEAAQTEIKIDTETTKEETSKEQTEEETSQEETTEAEKAQKEEAEDSLPEAYQEILGKYQNMIQEKWERDQAFEENLSGIVVDLNDIGNAANEVGYYLYDLDQDGKEELLIGEMDNDALANCIIFDAYTLVNGKAVQIFESESRNRYYLVEDEAGAVIIANEASNGAANSGWLYYVVNGTQLNVVQSVIFDAGEDEQNPWFMSTDDDWDVSNDEPVDENTAMSVIDSYTENYVKLDWMPVIE